MVPLFDHLFSLRLQKEVLGYTSGPLIAPEQFGEFFIPPFRRMVQGLKSLGFPVIMHNDGNIFAMIETVKKNMVSINRNKTPEMTDSL